jgi:hypothetical protein
VNIASAFRRNSDGTWICIAPASIEHARGRIQVSPGTVLGRDTRFMGVHLAAWLEEQSRSPLQLGSGEASGANASERKDFASPSRRASQF